MEEEEAFDAFDPATIAKRREDRKAELLREQQRRAQTILRQDKIEWEQLRHLMYMDHISPNYTDATTQVSTGHQAAYDGEADMLRWCLKAGADVNQKTAIGRTMLHHACDANQTRCIRLLLEQEADPNVRTLSLMTPLHICCQSNSYEAVLILLGEANFIVDIDAEDSRRRTPESMTTDKRVLKCIENYRRNFDEKQKADLLDYALTRLFSIFDTDKDQIVRIEDWAEKLMLLSEHFENVVEDKINETFAMADTNGDGEIDVADFKAAHAELFTALGIPYEHLMYSLSDMENTVFKEEVRLAQGGELVPEVVMARDQAVAIQRTRSMEMQAEEAWKAEEAERAEKEAAQKEGAEDTDAVERSGGEAQAQAEES
mmetsp:Transcript_64633/g.140731  ORF Transcript_64633/g.140731 Transcript_64633/m.140731 type:complete len:373 (+) Transcript_64633:86-1204(+)